jgi:hypothetical protein
MEPERARAARIGGLTMTSEPVQINCLSDLWWAVHYRRAVVVPTIEKWATPRSASFVLNMPGAVIYRMIAAGMYVYQPKPKGKQ